MEIVLDIPEDRKTIGTGRLCLLMALTLLTIALSVSRPPEAGAVIGGVGATGSYEVVAAGQ